MTSEGGGSGDEIPRGIRKFTRHLPQFCDECGLFSRTLFQYVRSEPFIDIQIRGRERPVQIHLHSADYCLDCCPVDHPARAEMVFEGGQNDG